LCRCGNKLENVRLKNGDNSKKSTFVEISNRGSFDQNMDLEDIQ
jgi:hypothetical protein